MYVCTASSTSSLTIWFTLEFSSGWGNLMALASHLWPISRFSPPGWPVQAAWGGHQLQIEVLVHLQNKIHQYGCQVYRVV